MEAVCLWIDPLPGKAEASACRAALSVRPIPVLRQRARCRIERPDDRALNVGDQRGARRTGDAHLVEHGVWSERVGIPIADRATAIQAPRGYPRR